VRSVIHSATDSVPAFHAMRIKSLWQLAEEEPLDVVVVTHDFLLPAEVAELKRRTRALVAMWFPDSIANFGRGFFMTAAYDALFFKDPYVVQILGHVLKGPLYHLPECFNPERHWLPEEAIGRDPAYQCDITTAGTQHSYRVAFFNHLVDYNVKVWGNPAPLWMPTGPVNRMYQGRGVYNHDKVRAFRGAKIVVNNLLYSETWGLNARAFEAAGAGAFQMVDWKPGLSQLFEDGKELISFTDIADLRNRIGYWLPREAERRAVAEAGMRRAHAEHTYAQRLELLLDSLAGTQQGYPVPKISYAA
jgi:spore maturation protein CgeB